MTDESNIDASSTQDNGPDAKPDIQDYNYTFQSLDRRDSSSSLKANDIPLRSIADSIRIICRRDSYRALDDAAEPSSPWLLDSAVTPMISSPHLMNIPNLKQRRNDQVQRHEEKKREARRRDAEKREARHQRGRSGSLDEAGKEVMVSVYNEDEQWERKRMDKLRKVHENSSSNSLASSRGDNSHEAEYSPTMDMLQALKEEFAKVTNPPGVSIMYGIVNAAVVLPVIMSFGNIIYNDEFFRPYLPVLVKLTVVSSIVHQICFSTYSTLPFAVGSVQDAGLIFLSTIASDIVKYCQDRGCSDEEILATSLVGLSIFTALLGVGLVVISQAKLAGYVQMLPTPVVGGYLAFIGFFCGQSALSLLSGIQVSGILQWYKFMDSTALFLMSPGIIGGLGIYYAVRKIKHMAVLPVSIVLIMMAFYMALKMSGLSLEDAKDIGLMSRADAPPVWYHSWDYIKFDKVIWHALPGQLLTLCSMIFVVALSSSLDIAAIGE